MAASSRSEATTRGPTRAATSASRTSSACAGEADAQHARVALDEQQRADRGRQSREDGVGEALAHGGGGDPVEQRGGEGHGVELLCAEGAEGGGDALARGGGRTAQPARDPS